MRLLHPEAIDCFNSLLNMRDGPMDEIGAKYEAVLTTIEDDSDSDLEVEKCRKFRGR